MALRDTQNVYNLIGRLNYSKTKIDDALSETSTNAVQNKVLTSILEALQSKAIINITETVELKDLEEGVYQVTNGGEVWFCPLGTTENQTTLRDGYLVYQYGAVAAMGITTQGFDILPDVLSGSYVNGVYYIYSLFHEVNDKLPKAGGTLNGNINMNNYDINNIDRAFVTNYLQVGDASSGLKFISNEEGNTILGLTPPEFNTAAVNKEYVDNATKDLGYNSVTLLKTTVGARVSMIKINQYNGASFNCKEYCALLEIPQASVATPIYNYITNEGSQNSYYVTLRGDSFMTTTQANKKVLIFVRYKQYSNTYWISESGAQLVNTTGIGTSWDDPYTMVPIYPRTSIAPYLNPEGAAEINFSGEFPAGTKITVWGDIKQ